MRSLWSKAANRRPRISGRGKGLVAFDGNGKRGMYRL